LQGFMRFPSISKRSILVLALTSLLSMFVYLAASGLFFRPGFPLDDSWIHLTYARNLADFGEWAFQPGTPSAGSTSPLWTGLLATGFFLNINLFVWTYAIGGMLLWSTGILGEMILRQVVPTYKAQIPWGGIFFMLEWRLVWSAASGMETLLHGLLITIVLGNLMSGSRRFMMLGLLVGLSVWVRPDGITLIGPLIIYALTSAGSFRLGLREVGKFTLGFAFLFVPYLLFNLVLSGAPFPNTFYAKQAEYSAWQEKPLTFRFMQLLLQFFAGANLALLPAAIIWTIKSMYKRDYGTLAGMIWFAGYIFLYIERLPVYQHGRYVIPAMPLFFIWGLAGLAELPQTKSLGRYRSAIMLGWNATLGGLCIAFWLFGAKTYAQDVAFIESEMVATAKWVSDNVPEGDIIAAHDIGALGYFDNHELVDLAGLVSPEVIPFIRDETRLAEYLDEVGVSYLIAFPGFYPNLSKQAKPVFSTESPITLQLGGENMVVFRWR